LTALTIRNECFMATLYARSFVVAVITCSVVEGWMNVRLGDKVHIYSRWVLTRSGTLPSTMECWLQNSTISINLLIVEM
jgi:hypothetical protein